MNYYIALQSLVSISIIALFAYWLFQDLAIDKFRIKMVKLRDDLFDDALAGRIPFDSDVYQITRQIMAGSIRSARRISIPFVTYIVFVAPRRQRIVTDELLERGLTSEQTALIKKYYHQMHSHTIRHAVYNSPFLCFLSMVFVVPMLLVILLAILVGERALGVALQFFEGDGRIEPLDERARVAGV